MSDFLSSEIVGTDRLIAKFSGDRITPATRATVAAEIDTLKEVVLDRMASLFRNSGGKMRDTLSTEVVDTASDVEGSVTAEGLPYLRIQEHGGTVFTPAMVPVNAKVLAFMAPHGLPFKGSGGNGMVFTMHTKAHPTTLPERSYMRSALAQRRSAIIAALKGTTILAMAAE